MAFAVPIDDAWSESLLAPARMPSPPPTLMVPAPPPKKARCDKKKKHRRVARRPPPKFDDEDSDDSDDDERLATLGLLHDLAKEMREARRIQTASLEQQKMALYGATLVVVILLLLTAHSYSRLQWATEALRLGRA